MPPPISARAKYAATLTGYAPQPSGNGARARYAAQLTEPRGGGIQDSTSPERVLGSRAKALASLQAGAPHLPPAPPSPALVVTMPGGRLAVYTPMPSPLDPTGLFTRHVVWLPPTRAPQYGREQTFIRQGHPFATSAASDGLDGIDWSRLWQRVLAGLPKPTAGFIFYGEDAHATGSVPTHARWGQVLGSYDITYLQRIMDIATSSWEGRLHIPHPTKQVREAMAKTIQQAFTSREKATKFGLEVVVTALKQLKNCLGAKSVGEHTVNTGQEAYRQLQRAGWVPRQVDSTAVARLPVHALVPQKVTYSGRKTTQAQIEEFRKEHYADEGIRGSEGYVSSVEGDSVYTFVKYDNQNREVSRDTIPAGRPAKTSNKGK